MATGLIGDRALRNVKIQCTIGPSCNDVRTLSEMIDAGMDGARINLSHGSAVSQEDKLASFRKACENRNGAECSIMYDIRGPEIRVGEMPEGGLLLEPGETVTIHCSESTDMSSGAEVDREWFGKVLPVNYEELAEEVSTGMQILIDDGKISLVVEDVNDRDIICLVETGGPVFSRKGLNVPDAELHMDYLGDEDKEDILFCIRNKVDYIAASFVRRAEDVIGLRRFLDENGGQEIGIIAKIENREAVGNLESIVAAADQILIARGDLGVEAGMEKVPALQKLIVRKCRQMGKAVIIATQFLDSMTERPVPTRAEVSDIANAVFDGTTDIMVTGETASGRYPVEVVLTMNRIISQAEADITDVNCGYL